MDTTIKPIIGDRITATRGHMRTHNGTVTEADNGEGYGIKFDYVTVFVRLPATDFKVARTSHELFVTGKSPTN